MGRAQRQRGAGVAGLPLDLARRLSAAGARVVVTGATGWLGRVTLDLLDGVVPVAAFASRPRDGVRALADIEAPPGDGPVLLLHYAFLTQDRARSMDLAAFVEANVAISATVLDWIAAQRPAGVLLTSSGAVTRGLPLAQDPYGALKRLDELAFPEACRRAGARLRIARVYNVAGRHMTKPELYALGDLVASALRGEPLRVRAAGRVVRSYAAVDDVVALALAELLARDGPSQLLFETAGETVEVGELAAAVRDALGRPDLPIERPAPPADGAPDDVYVGDGGIMAELMARHELPPMPLAEQIRQTAESLK